MYDDLPGWYITVHPIYYFTGKLLSILALILLIAYVIIKLARINKETYQAYINLSNWLFCALSTVILACNIFEFWMAWSSGYSAEQFSFFSRAIGAFWFIYIAFMWPPLLLTQLFWIKNFRVNINWALFIIFMFNIHTWIERIYIILTTVMRDW